VAAADESSQNPKTNICVRFGVRGTVVAGQRGVTSPNASTPARFRGWEVVLAGGGLSDPRNEHSCSFRGCVVLEAGRRWVEPRRRAVMLGFRGRGTVVAAREEPDPRNEHSLLVSGMCGAGGRQKAGGTPKMSSRAQLWGTGDGSGGQRGARSPKASIPARFRGWEVVLAGGGLSDPRNSLLVSGMCGTGGRQKAGGTPETSSRARRRGSGDGGGGGQMSESRKRAECARFRGWEAGG